MLLFHALMLRCCLKCVCFMHLCLCRGTGCCMCSAASLTLPLTHSPPLEDASFTGRYNICKPEGWDLPSLPSRSATVATVEPAKKYHHGIAAMAGRPGFRKMQPATSNSLNSDQLGAPDPGDHWPTWPPRPQRLLHHHRALHILWG